MSIVLTQEEIPEKGGKFFNAEFVCTMQQNDVSGNIYALVVCCPKLNFKTYVSMYRQSPIFL